MERAIAREIRPRPEIRAWSLRFGDAALEREFQDDYIRRNLPWIRLAHVFGIVTWAVFGLLAQAVLREGRAEDLVLRFGVAIPTVALSLGLTYAPWYPRVWQWCMGGVVLASAAIWSLHRIVVEHSRPDWGYAGIMLILAFLFTFSRVGFPFAAATAVGIIAVYNGVTIWLLRDAPLDQLMANYFVLSVGVLGMAASYWLDRSTRLVFLRERQVEDERRRADDLLRDILPGEIVDRLKLRDGRADAGYIAEGLDEVTVLFADLVGFTDQARRTAPQQLVAALDGHLLPLRRDRRPPPAGEDQDRGRRVHGRGGCPEPPGQRRRGGGRDGARHHGVPARGPLAERRPRLREGRHRGRPRRGGGDRPAEVRLRPVG